MNPTPIPIEPAQPVLVWDAPVRVFHSVLVLGFAGAYITPEADGWRWVHKSGRPGDGIQRAGHPLAALLLRAVLGFWGWQWQTAPARLPMARWQMRATRTPTTRQSEPPRAAHRQDPSCLAARQDCCEAVQGGRPTGCSATLLERQDRIRFRPFHGSCRPAGDCATAQLGD